MVWEAFNIITANMGISLENLVLVVVLLAGVIGYIRDFKAGLVTHFLSSSLLAMLWYALEMNHTPSFIVAMISFVLLCFSLYPISKTTQAGGII